MEHLLPASGIRHGKAARTGRACNPYRWKPFDRCSALAPVSKRQPVCVIRSDMSCRPPPVPGIRAQRLRASQRESLPRAVHARMPGMWIGHAILVVLHLRTHKTKRPRTWIRGRSRSSEIGATDLRMRRSVEYREAFQPCVRRQRAQVRDAAVARRAWLYGDMREEVHRRYVVVFVRRYRRVGAHVTRAVNAMQALSDIFFDRRTNGGVSGSTGSDAPAIVTIASLRGATMHIEPHGKRVASSLLFPLSIATLSWIAPKEILGHEVQLRRSMPSLRMSRVSFPRVAPTSPDGVCGVAPVAAVPGEEGRVRGRCGYPGGLARIQECVEVMPTATMTMVI